MATGALVERKKDAGREAHQRSLPAIACDWEITYLSRRISTPEVFIGFRRLVLFVAGGRRLKAQFWPMLAQPGAMAAVVRTFLSDQRPEAR